MEYKDIKALTDEEIREKILLEQDMVRKLKFSHAISPLENPANIRESKRTIAKLKTEQRARTIAEKK